MKEQFNIGDLVTSRTYGHGYVGKSSSTKFPLTVIFDTGISIHYTADGRIHQDLPVSLEKGHLIKDVSMIDGNVIYH